ncbi:MAG: hypothetical protein ACTSWN_11575 [Promethearchaeota archaeon]
MAFTWYYRDVFGLRITALSRSTCISGKYRGLSQRTTVQACRSSLEKKISAQSNEFSFNFISIPFYWDFLFQQTCEHYSPHAGRAVQQLQNTMPAGKTTCSLQYFTTYSKTCRLQTTTRT